MKRLMTIIAAAAAFAGPMTLAVTEAQAKPGNGKGHAKHGVPAQPGMNGYRDGVVYESDGHWDRGLHNGYYHNGRWFYGPPPGAFRGQPGDYYGQQAYRPGYVVWRPGATLPAYYRTNTFLMQDYGRYGLQAPPPGYYWYNSGRNFLLANAATGLIQSVIGR